ncbi:MAG: 50S ribosomal protein L30 [Nitrososphaerota archaeon]|nr:50S ribosomal protein L30 [Nitrososphaerota archaeon]
MSSEVKKIKGSSATKSGSLLVVNMRGLVNTRTPVKTTLEQLYIARRFNATIVPDTEAYRGMLRLSKEHVAWCKITADVAEKLLSKRSEKSTGVRYLEADLKNSKEFNSFGELAKALELGNVNLSHLDLMRPFFRLNPPKGGFRKSTRRQHSDNGILGHNEDLTRYVEKML